MSGTTLSSQRPADVADVCHTAAADIGDGLRALRAQLAAVDPARLGMPATRLAELRAGFDIYARMLDDALDDIAGELSEHRSGPAPWTGPRRSDAELSCGRTR